jgi:hypothetical protein
VIAALFVETDGEYYGHPLIDPWDAIRDARMYTGPHPVIAHPPCSRWANGLAQVVAAQHPHLGVGMDAGCFKSALRSVRTYGGVLEHPAKSLAFEHHGLPRPQLGSWQECGPNEYVTQVYQGMYGHVAAKPTWLFYASPSGHPPFDLDWRKATNIGTNVGTGTRDGLTRVLSGAKAAATPPAFKNLLIRLAMHAGQRNPVRETP